ncbi:MAG TPA: molecular chaperone TorD family protein [Polyangiaceae bacterium]|nr:molecular chaperone TorD family protein [Polyangiaceae bacterium]
MPSLTNSHATDERLGAKSTAGNGSLTPVEPYALLTGALEFSLASLILEYPTREVVLTLVELQESDSCAPALLALASACRAGLRHVQVAYAALFEGVQSKVSLYETEHGVMRGAAKGKDLADIAGFYRAFGLTPNEENAHEMLDHIAVELEFYSQLLIRQSALATARDAEGCEIVEDARRKFLHGHLGRFAGVIAKQPAVQECPVYGPALAWCAALVQLECERLRVEPPPLDFFPLRETSEEEAMCGAVHLPILQSAP